MTSPTAPDVERYLRSSRLFAPLCEALRPRLEDSLVVAPVERVGRWFSVTQDADGPFIALGSAPGGIEQIVFRPPAGRSMDWWYPSPGGTYVALGTSACGTEQSTLQVLDTRTGTLLPEQISHTSFCTVAWLPAEEGFYYSAGLKDDRIDAQKHIFFHELGTEPNSRPAPLQLRTQACLPQVSPSGRFVVAVASEIEPRPDFILDRDAGERGWQPFLRDERGVFFGGFHGNDYIALTTDEAERGRIVAIPAEPGGERQRWRELVPESERMLRSVSVFDDRIVVGHLKDGAAELTVFDIDGSFVGEVPVAERSAIGRVGYWWGHAQCQEMVAAGSTSFSFVTSSLDRKPVAFSCDLQGTCRPVSPEHAPELELDVERIGVPTSDGRVVRAWIVRRRDVLDVDGPQPTMIYGYGGWNIPLMPAWSAAGSLFVEAGGTLVWPNLRGGGEFGWTWWQEGRLEAKQRVFDDLYELTEHLIAVGMTTPSTLGLVGASNGGLLAAVALTQRPELWRAVVSLVPVTDLVGIGNDPYPREAFEEYGDPSIAKWREVVRAYSPCENVRPSPYPASLLVCGEHDIRCPAWHGEKFASLLNGASTGDKPVLCRVVPEAGHGVGFMASAEHTAEWLAFMFDAVGLSLPSRRDGYQ